MGTRDPVPFAGSAFMFIRKGVKQPNTRMCTSHPQQ
jgi:hypothetical protein